MRKPVLKITTLLFVLVSILLPQPRPVTAASDGFSHDLVQLAWFYKPPANGDLKTPAAYFDNYILTRRDEAARESLKTLGAGGPFLQYYLSNAVHNPGPNSCTARPYANTVADQPGDFCWLRENHPDWFLRDSAGQIIQSWNDDELVALMDPANPGWQQFFIERLLARQDEFGWDGLFLDNLDASLDRFRRMNKMPAAYTSDAAYQDAFFAFLQVVRDQYSAVTGRPVLANITLMEDPAVWDRYMHLLDGAMDEDWAVGWHGEYLSVREWRENLQRAQRSQADGKRLILVAQGDSSADLERQRFAFASYLLVANGEAAFRYASSDAYDAVWVYSNYRVKLGEPKGAAEERAGGLWVREFSGGRVTVNPTAHTASIETNANRQYRAYLPLIIPKWPK